jgi:putative toxin-antitoxin system antitoxin component (TIGR02293 family)
MHLSSIAKILGGKGALGTELQSQMDLVQLGRRGVSKRALLSLAAYLGLSVKEISHLLPVTERTIQRYSSKDRFRSNVSDHILHLAEVAARGEEVFGDKARFLAWMRQPSAALGGNIPEELLNSRIGTELVLDELGRIEHGIVV